MGPLEIRTGAGGIRCALPSSRNGAGDPRTNFASGADVSVGCDATGSEDVILGPLPPPAF